MVYDRHPELQSKWDPFGPEDIYVDVYKASERRARVSV